MKLRKGEVRNLLSKPKTLVVDGKTVKVAPGEVTVFKDRWGRYTVKEKGSRITAEERRLGLKRARGKEAAWIKSEYEQYGSELKMRKLNSKESRTLRSWQVGSLKGWVNVRRGEFISRDYPTHLGDMERLMRSLSATTWALNNDVDFEELWYRLSGDEKFDAMSRLVDINWSNFFNTYIDSDGTHQDGINDELQERGLTYVLELLTGGAPDALEL